MAITKEGILGGFSGKVGNVVGVQLNGENILRAAPRPSKNPPSEKQCLQRIKFSKAVEFTKPFLFIVERFFNEHAKPKERKNKIISYTLNYVLKSQEQNFTIEWSKFLLSSGTLSGFNQLDFVFSGNELSILWADNTSQGFANAEDDIYAVIANETLQKIEFLEKISTRNSLGVNLTLPNWAATETVHIYLFLNNPKKNQSSNSFYLGQFSQMDD